MGLWLVKIFQLYWNIGVSGHWRAGNVSSGLARFLTDRCASAAGWLGLVSHFEQE